MFTVPIVVTVACLLLIAVHIPILLLLQRIALAIERFLQHVELASEDFDDCKSMTDGLDKASRNKLFRG